MLRSTDTLMILLLPHLNLLDPANSHGGVQTSHKVLLSMMDTGGEIENIFMVSKISKIMESSS